MICLGRRATWKTRLFSSGWKRLIHAKNVCLGEIVEPDKEPASGGGEE